MMKKIKLLLITTLLCLMLPMTVSASTYKNDDRVEILSALMPEDGTKITFTIPKGSYPKNSKIAIYGEKNVYCPVPGIPMETKTPDKNPFTLLSEYTFSETDIKALETADSTFITTMKFDVQCGDIYGKVIAASQTARPSETQANRPSGGNSNSTDPEGNPLTVMAPGTKLDTQFVLNGNILSYVAPQGSYTLADYLVVFDKDNVAILNTVITGDMMETLATNGFEVRSIVEGLDSTEGLFVIVAETNYEIGAVGELPIDQNDDVDDIDKGGVSPVVIGVIVFILVAGGGIGYTVMKSKKK